MWTHRHAFLLALVFVLLGIAAKAAEAGETLSNGIVLPREWPPRLSDFPTVRREGPDSSTVWLDLEEKDSTRRFKMVHVIGADEDPVTKWNNNVQSAGGGFLVVGDELYFYVSGRSGVPGSNKAGTLAAGLATLRRDGFASMD